MTESVKTILPQQMSIVLMSLLLILMMSNCASPAQRYYSLSPSKPVPAVESSNNLPTLSFAIDQVQVPQHFEHTNVLLKNQDGSLKFMQLERWAAPLPEEIHDALERQVKARLQTCSSYHQDQQRPSSAPQFRISATLVQMDAVVDGHFSARLDWSVQRLRDRQYRPGGNMLELPAVKDINAVISATQALTSAAARDIAATICANAD